MAREQARGRGTWVLAVVGAVAVLADLGIALIRGPEVLATIVAVVVPCYAVGVFAWWRAARHPVALQALTTSTVLAILMLVIGITEVGRSSPTGVIVVPVSEKPTWLELLDTLAKVLSVVVLVLVARLIALLPDGRYRFGYERVVLRALWLVPLGDLVALLVDHSFTFGLLAWVLLLGPVMLGIRYFMLPRAHRRTVRLLLGTALVAATPLILALNGVRRSWAGWPTVSLLAIMIVLVGIVVAAVRYRLFGVDLSVRWTPREGLLWLIAGLCLGGVMLYLSAVTGTFLPLGLTALLVIAAYAVRLSIELATRVNQVQRQAGELSASRTRIVHAQDSERRRIERHLHDGIQQELIALIAKLRLARNQLPRGTDRTSVVLTELQDDTYRVIDQLRELSHGIHPAELTDQGVVAAVRSRARRAPIPVTVLAEPPVDTARYAIDIEESAFFLVSEALTNILKHAHASQATIRLSQAAGSLIVEIIDDGTGIPHGQREGSGLTGLRDRVGATGGDLDVTSNPEGGTTVRAHLPAREATADADA